MPSIIRTLRAAYHPPFASATAAATKPTVPTVPTVLVAGGGGALGSVVLEALLARRCSAQIKVLANRNLIVAMRGLEPVVIEGFDTFDAFDHTDHGACGARPHAAAVAALADLAVIVFDVERHANGRELAFVRPQPHDLSRLAHWLHGRGVRRLIVVLPHAPAGLPDALKHGLANLDEQTVAALGFEHVVFVRSAHAPATGRATRWLQRLADGMLAQLRMMVASANQPVRARKVAQFVAELAAQLPSSMPGTRVAPPELVWQAAQLHDASGLVQAWLARGEQPAASAQALGLRQ